MATRKLPSFGGVFFALMLALAPAALTGCQSSGGGSSDGHSGHSHGALSPSKSPSEMAPAVVHEDRRSPLEGEPIL